MSWQMPNLVVSRKASGFYPLQILQGSIAKAFELPFPGGRYISNMQADILCRRKIADPKHLKLIAE